MRETVPTLQISDFSKPAINCIYPRFRTRCTERNPAREETVHWAALFRTNEENLESAANTAGKSGSDRTNIWGEIFPRALRALARTDGESATTRVTTKSIYHQTYEIAKSLYSPRTLRTATADRPRRESASGANTITPFVTQISFFRQGCALQRTCSANGKYGCRVNMLGKSGLSTNILRGKYIIRSSCRNQPHKSEPAYAVASRTE